MKGQSQDAWDHLPAMYNRCAGGNSSCRADPLLLVRVDLCAGADVSLELPTIVVCGQQSAGKSSVVEVRTGLALSVSGSRHEHRACEPRQTRAGCADARHHQPML
jgi:hypothetical protein